MRDTFIQELTNIAQARPEVMLLTGDLGFGVLNDFTKRFPRQFLNVGVAEQNMTGVATGLALEGKIVFTYSLGNFPSLRCLEQIRNDACYHDASVKVVTVGGGMSYGAVGASHHATEDLAIMRALPNIVVVSPGDLWEVAEATKALVKHRGPAYFRLDKSAASTGALPGERFELGKARLLREGEDLTLVATGGILGEAIAVADLLERDNIHCRVLSMHTVKPLDVRALEKAADETGGVVVIEEHTVDGGLAGAVAENLLECGSAPQLFIRFGLRSCFSSIVGSQMYLRKMYGLDAETIAAAIVSRMRGAPRCEQVLVGAI